MSESEAIYGAMRAYIRAAVELEVRNALPDAARAAVATELRAGRSHPGRGEADGVGVVDVRLEEGALVVCMSDGSERNLGPLLVPSGEPVEGALDPAALLEDLERRIEARFLDLQARSLADVYRDVYQEGETYQRGEMVTWDGSLWMAKVQTEAKPGTPEQWKLVVKKGRDGKR